MHSLWPKWYPHNHHRRSLLLSLPLQHILTHFSSLSSTLPSHTHTTLYQSSSSLPPLPTPVSSSPHADTPPFATHTHTFPSHPCSTSSRPPAIHPLLQHALTPNHHPCPPPSLPPSLHTRTPPPPPTHPPKTAQRKPFQSRDGLTIYHQGLAQANRLLRAVGESTSSVTAVVQRLKFKAEKESALSRRRVHPS